MGVKIAVCHQYVLPDGNFGASGLPDPKVVEYQGHVLFCHTRTCGCPVCTAEPEDWGVVIEEMESKFSVKIMRWSTRRREVHSFGVAEFYGNCSLLVL